MRFTIRDLLWLTLVVAIGVAWWISDSRWHTLADNQRRQINKLAEDVENLNRWLNFGIGAKQYTLSGKPKYWMHENLAPAEKVPSELTGRSNSITASYSDPIDSFVAAAGKTWVY